MVIHKWRHVKPNVFKDALNGVVSESLKELAIGDVIEMETRAQNARDNQPPFRFSPTMQTGISRDVGVFRVVGIQSGLAGETSDYHVVTVNVRQVVEHG